MALASEVADCQDQCCKGDKENRSDGERKTFAEATAQGRNIEKLPEKATF